MRLDKFHWIDKNERMPEEADYDQQGCVLVWHSLMGVMVMGRHNLEKYGGKVTHWARVPEAPAIESQDAKKPKHTRESRL